MTKKLNFDGVKTPSSDLLYDAIYGHDYSDEIKDEYTRQKFQDAKEIMEAFADYCEENDLAL
ncbi:MAG: hypothetical protein Q4A74_08745 [Cardiobacteriaceae bacterium]|nr:hypothetical protein [Cardiobacteriaceae bacterium]